MPQEIWNYLPWIIPGAIVLLGLFVYGARDLLRLSFGRIWAIGGVCFRDAIRRRVLWITPLAILGIIIVAQLQKPVDEPDAIRQTIKFCFFASALVVTIIALISAATNLPREIENRVVYTIVTKPVTRLEIVLGKLVGFARVSAVMLLIMGVFTLGYLNLRAWYLGRQITQALQSPSIDPAQREWLKHFETEGLLFSQTIHEPQTLTQFTLDKGKEFTGVSDHWILGGAQDAVIPFSVQPGNLGRGADPAAPGDAEKAYFFLKIPFRRLDTGATASGQTPPEAQVQIMDAAGEHVIINAEQLSGRPAPGPEEAMSTRPASALLDGFARIEIPRTIARQLEDIGQFQVQLIGPNPDTLYQINKDAVTIVVGYLADPQSAKLLGGVDADAEPLTRGGLGRSGQQLRKAERGIEPVAVFHYQNAPVPASGSENASFELKVGLSRSGADSDADEAAVLDVRVYDPKNRRTSPPALVYPESKHAAFFTLPADYLRDGEFDLVVRNLSSGSTIELTPISIQLVAGREPFAINLFKGLLVLWLFALLVSIIAFFCSTFLSWPIAVVLTLMVVLGRWAVTSLDIGGSGFGQQIAQEFAGRNAGLANVVSKSVDTMTLALTTITRLLPDIASFGVTEQIERGATISLTQLGAPVMVLLLFGLPLTTLAYVFLRNKEVAP